MRRIIRLTESDLTRLVKRVIEEAKDDEDDDDDMYVAEYGSKKIKGINKKLLKQNKIFDLLEELKEFKLGSGHEEKRLKKLDGDRFVLRLIPYYGHPGQTIYFEKEK
jgi:hypothetical protein